MLNLVAMALNELRRRYHSSAIDTFVVRFPEHTHFLNSAPGGRNVKFGNHIRKHQVLSFLFVDADCGFGSVFLVLLEFAGKFHPHLVYFSKPVEDGVGEIDGLVEYFFHKRLTEFSFIKAFEAGFEFAL